MSHTSHSSITHTPHPSVTHTPPVCHTYPTHLLPTSLLPPCTYPCCHHTHILVATCSFGGCRTIRKRRYQRANQEFSTGRLCLLYCHPTLLLHSINILVHIFSTIYQQHMNIVVHLISLFSFSTFLLNTPSQHSLSTHSNAIH